MSAIGVAWSRVSRPPPCSALTYLPLYRSASFIGVFPPADGADDGAAARADPVDVHARVADLRITVDECADMPLEGARLTHRRSMSGARQRSGNRQISLETFVGTRTRSSCSRSSVEQYCVPLLT